MTILEELIKTKPITGLRMQRAFLNIMYTGNWLADQNKPCC